MAKKYLSQESLYCVRNFCKNINKTDSLRQNMHIKFPWASDKETGVQKLLKSKCYGSILKLLTKEKANIMASDGWAIISTDYRKDISLKGKKSFDSSHYFSTCSIIISVSIK